MNIKVLGSDKQTKVWKLSKTCREPNVPLPRKSFSKLVYGEGGWSPYQNFGWKVSGYTSAVDSPENVHCIGQC